MLDDIAFILKLDKPVLFKQSINRGNLFYEVRRVEMAGKKVTKEAKFERMADKILKFIKENNYDGESGLIYCPKKFVLVFVCCLATLHSFEQKRL